MSIEVFPLPPSGPSLAEITAAITSNAAPASVTMPAITSSITTNAASSGVTMAAITSAITTNAASSGVTMAAITTAIQNNAGFGNNATIIASSTLGSSANTLSWSGTYKQLYFLGLNMSVASGWASIWLRFNGDTGSNYSSFRYQTNSNTNTTSANDNLLNTGHIMGTSTGGGAPLYGYIMNPTTTARRWITGFGHDWENNRAWIYNCSYNSTTAITSMSVNSSVNINGFFYVYGVN